jgi:nucleoside-diphosphate-sugar epimerase
MYLIVDNNKNMNVLITGGSGFLGKAVIKELLGSDAIVKPDEIRVFDIKQYDDGSNDKRIKFIKGDIRNYKEVKDAVKGVDIVIHTAALIDWGTKPKSIVFGVNVGGTENIIKACHENKVNKLVHTSSLDAVFSGKPLVNIDESQPYPAKHITSYGESKELSEKLVLESNSPELKTVVLRPSDIYGEGDPYHIGSLIHQAKKKMYVRIGDRKSKCQHVYVGNMAYALVKAAKALLDGNSSVYGKVYFITDGQATNFFEFFDKIIIGTGYKLIPGNVWIPKWLAYPIAGISELTAVIAKPFKSYTPKFSRFAVKYITSDFIFNSEKAKNDFGFEPKYDEEESFSRTINFYKK